MAEGGQAKRMSREQRAQEIFDDGNKAAEYQTGNGNLLRDTKNLIRDLEKLRILEVNKWWEKITLTKYLEYKRIPRGLRILLLPTLNDLGPDLVKRWQTDTTDCSFKLMETLIAHAERRTEERHVGK